MVPLPALMTVFKINFQEGGIILVLSYNNHDCDPMSVVPVIASFDTDGHIAPLYVRLGGTACKVDSYWIGKSFSEQIRYHCKIIDPGCHCRKPITLTYYRREDIWTCPYNIDTSSPMPDEIHSKAGSRKGHSTSQPQPDRSLL